MKLWLANRSVKQAITRNRPHREDAQKFHIDFTFLLITLDNKLKIINTFLLATILIGCTSNQPISASYIEKAESKIAQHNWEDAYRFLEDGFISTNPEMKERSFLLIKKFPQILIAGKNTFSSEKISKSISAHGIIGFDIEKQRLEKYKIVADPKDYENAKSNIDLASIEIDIQRKEIQRITEQKRIEEQRLSDLQKKAKDEALAAIAHKKTQQRAALIEAAQKSRFICQNQTECKKAFSLTQIFVSENSDMKIQVATETIIETYNPNESMKTGLKAIKIPKKGDSAEIVVTASCRDEGRDSFKDICDNKLLSIYRTFPTFLQSSLRQ